jgi:hypothetical protein
MISRESNSTVDLINQQQRNCPQNDIIQCKDKGNRTGPEKMAVIRMKTSTKVMDEINYREKSMIGEKRRKESSNKETQATEEKSLHLGHVFLYSSLCLNLYLDTKDSTPNCLN